MLGRVLVEDLAQRLPQSTVYASSGARDWIVPDATIEIEVQRLDLDRDGNLLLIAQASVTFKNRASPDMRSFHISQPPPSPGVEGQVAATSTALAQVADRIASACHRPCSAAKPEVPPGTVVNDFAIPAEEPADRVEAVLRECPGCGLFQIEPALAPGTTAHCERCGTACARHDVTRLSIALALTVAALILLGVMCLSMLMTVQHVGHRAWGRDLLRPVGTGAARHDRASPSWWCSLPLWRRWRS